MNYLDCVNKLDLIGQFIENTGLYRARKVLKALGNPERELKVIHIAGTNGKGSVCMYLSNMIEKIGHKVGMFTSPHLTDIRERIVINNEMISKEDFAYYFNVVEKAIKTVNDDYKKDKPFELAYFDYFFVIAMLYFRDKRVDYVVLETGLGGALDATNSVEKPVLSIITTISLEHTMILGDTIEKIAKEKAGIIKPNVPVVYSNTVRQAGDVIHNKALELQTESVSVDENDYLMIKNKPRCIDFLIHNEYYNNDCFKISGNALYQLENVTIALTAMAKLVTSGIIMGKLSELLPKLKSSVYETLWPGRMEWVSDNIIVDGAHNPQGIKAFVESVNSLYNESQNLKGTDIKKPCDLLFSVVSDKNYEEMIATLCECPFFSKYYVTITGGARKLAKESICEAFAGNGVFDVESFDSVEEAISAIKRERKDEYYLFATGSLYLVGDIKRILQ